MAEKESPYKQGRPEDAITDEQTKEALTALDHPWQPERARFQMASVLAVGLLVLFGLTVACSSVIIVALVITWAVQGTGDLNADSLHRDSSWHCPRILFQRITA
jgi:fatty acid desaturase